MTPEMTRHLGTYSDAYWLMYLLCVVAMLIFARGVMGKFRIWQSGTGSLRERLDRPGERLAFLLVNAIGQVRIIRKPYPGIFHALLSWSFVCFGVGTVAVMLQERFGIPAFQGRHYLWLSLGLDIFALLALAAIFVAAGRRRNKEAMHHARQERRWPALLLLGAVLATGILLEGLRMAATPDPWSAWSPAGRLVAFCLAGINREVLMRLHQGMWWFHLALSLGCIASIPYTGLFHALVAPASQFFGNPHAARALAPIDFGDETVARFGAATIGELNWKHLLELDACTGCGRCHEQCPAVAAGKPLSPQKLTQGLKHLSGMVLGSDRPNLNPPLAGEAISETALWSCPTCRACEVACPVVVEHVPKIVEMRRHLVLMESRFPTEAQRLFQNMSAQQNPWGISRASRSDWARTLEVPLLAENPAAEYLYWPGCTAAFDPRNQKVASSLVTVMRAGKVNFAILGKEEMCCGDPARRLGNEHLFQTLAVKNVEALKRHRVKNIVTSCPHCFNTLKNEYPQFGGTFRILHHAELIRDLIGSGRIKLSQMEETITYHDSCYLGRYNRIFDAPREVLGIVGSGGLLEMPRNGLESFCCGGGGGLMWLDDHTGSGLHNIRAQEAVSTGADILATACPFCLSMLQDGSKHENGDRPLETKDIAEIVSASLAS